MLWHFFFYFLFRILNVLFVIMNAISPSIMLGIGLLFIFNRLGMLPIVNPIMAK